MLSKAEIRRRKQQSARDKAKHREEQEERDRRRQQSARDGARHRAEQARFFWTIPTPLPPPLALEEIVEPAVELMDPAIEKTKVSKTRGFLPVTLIIPTAPKFWGVR